MTNMVGMVLSGSCERVDEIRITESVDCSTYESAGTQTAMGFSQDPDTPGLAESVRRESEVFAESAAMMADAIGVKLDRMTFDVSSPPPPATPTSASCRSRRARSAGVYGYHRGWVGDRNVVSVGFNWTMGDHVTPPKPLEHGHVIQVFGLPNMRTVLHCLPPKDWTEPGFMGLGMIYTAMPVTNAVPAVVAAAARHRDAEGPAAGRRPRRRASVSDMPRQFVLCPDPSRSSSAARRPAIAINKASPLPRTSSALPVGPVQVGGDEAHTARPARRRGWSGRSGRNPAPCAAARARWVRGSRSRPSDVLLVDHPVGATRSCRRNLRSAVRLGVRPDQRDNLLGRVGVVGDADRVDASVFSRPFRNV